MRSHIPRCSRHLRSSSTRSRVATRNRRCAGRARARTRCPQSCSRSTASGSATRRWPSCCATTATACRRQTNPSKVPSIRTATRSSSTSTRKRRTASCGACRSSPSTPRRRSWSATSRTADASGNRRASPTWWMSKTSRPMRSTRLIPCGVYDLAANNGFVGVDHDTPLFAVTSIEAWRSQVGAKRYPEAREIFITADAGGSNSYRSHVWKHQLQRVADKLGHVDPCQPLSTRLQQVEQGGAPPVLVHLDQLARTPSADRRDRRQPRGTGRNRPRVCRLFRVLSLEAPPSSAGTPGVNPWARGEARWTPGAALRARGAALSPRTGARWAPGVTLVARSVPFEARASTLERQRDTVSTMGAPAWPPGVTPRARASAPWPRGVTARAIAATPSLKGDTPSSTTAAA